MHNKSYLELKFSSVWPYNRKQVFLMTCDKHINKPVSVFTNNIPIFSHTPIYWPCPKLKVISSQRFLQMKNEETINVSIIKYFHVIKEHSVQGTFSTCLWSTNTLFCCVSDFWAALSTLRKVR